MRAIGLSLLLLVGVAGVWLLPTLSVQPESLSSTLGDINRGAYLARVSGCVACHTDAEGGAAVAGGAPIETPFGVFYAPNISTDKTHGLGNWTLEDFSRALRQGRSPEGKSYYPAFPYRFYTRFSDQDIADLWAAFKTVPPVAQQSRPHQLNFPFNIREALLGWQALFFTPERFTPADERYARGQYLVTVAGHCSSCHTPRNLLGALDTSRRFEGAGGLPSGGRSPAITSSALQKAGWTEQTLAYALRTGIKPDGDVLGASMGEAIRHGLSFLTPDDSAAMAAYLLRKADP